MPFQTPQGLEQLMAMFRMMQAPQQQNANNIQGMMGLQNPFGAGPQQSVFPGMMMQQPGQASQPGTLPGQAPQSGQTPQPGTLPGQTPQPAITPTQPGQTSPLPSFGTGLPLSQYGYGGEARFHNPFQFKFPAVKKVESRPVNNNDDWDDDDSEGSEGDDDPGDGNGGGGGAEA